MVPDGIFGRNTMAAVTAFQRYCGLPATGVMNQTTWERLVQTYQAQLVQQAPAEAMQPILNPLPDHKGGGEQLPCLSGPIGSAGPGRRIPGLAPNADQWDPDASTVTAVRRFQTLCGLPVTGEVDRHTWKCLCRHYALATGDGTGNCQKGKNHL